MACTSFSETLPPARRPRRPFPLLATVVAMSVLTVTYGWFVLLEAARPARDGGVALLIVGVGLALLACAGGWGALRGHTWGVSLGALAARGNLFLLGSAIALTAWDEWAGLGARASRAPLVALTAFGAAQAAMLLLAGRTSREADLPARERAR
jgi:hypothetical protein